MSDRTYNGLEIILYRVVKLARYEKAEKTHDIPDGPVIRIINCSTGSQGKRHTKIDIGINGIRIFSGVATPAKRNFKEYCRWAVRTFQSPCNLLEASYFNAISPILSKFFKDNSYIPTNEDLEACKVLQELSKNQ